MYRGYLYITVTKFALPLNSQWLRVDYTPRLDPWTSFTVALPRGQGEIRRLVRCGSNNIKYLLWHVTPILDTDGERAEAGTYGMIDWYVRIWRYSSSPILLRRRPLIDSKQRPLRLCWWGIVWSVDWLRRVGGCSCRIWKRATCAVYYMQSSKCAKYIHVYVHT